jgi:hypothetical protein
MPFKFPHILTQSLIISGLAFIYHSLPNAYASQNTILMAQQPSERSAERDQLKCRNVRSASVFARTELFFGSLKPDGTQVSDPEFQTFLNREITPRFPDGLTLLTGFGQFRNSQGRLIKERSRLLILLYPIEQAQDGSLKIEQIRKAYNATFQQESVLRTDELSCVSF